MIFLNKLNYNKNPISKNQLQQKSVRSFIRIMIIICLLEFLRTNLTLQGHSPLHKYVERCTAILQRCFFLGKSGIRYQVLVQLLCVQIMLLLDNYNISCTYCIAHTTNPAYKSNFMQDIYAVYQDNYRTVYCTCVWLPWFSLLLSPFVSTLKASRKWS